MTVQSFLYVFAGESIKGDKKQKELSLALYISTFKSTLFLLSLLISNPNCLMHSKSGKNLLIDKAKAHPL